MIEHRRVYDYPYLVRYGMGKMFPEYAQRARSVIERPHYLQGVNYRIMQSKDHLSTIERREADISSSMVGSYVDGASTIARTSCGITPSYQDSLVHALRDPHAFEGVRKNQSGLIAELSQMFRPSVDKDPLIKMSEVGERLAKFLQVGQVLHAHGPEQLDQWEGIRFLSQVDLAVSILWGYNGDASSKVRMAFDTPELEWLQIQEQILVSRGIIPSTV